MTDSKDSRTPFLRFDEEKFYADAKSFAKDKTLSMLEFPSIFDKPTVSLSVIVPAKDEEKRLSTMLDECIEYLEKMSKDQPGFTYEIIIVDDFSQDETFGLAMNYAERLGNEKMRVLKLMKNRGKGGAVRLGFWAARGEQLLFADADGATKFSDLSKLYKEMKELTSFDAKTNGNDKQDRGDDFIEFPPAVVVGSRAHLEEESIAKRSFFRTVLMLGFHLLVWLLCVRTIRDTQCGFKLMTRRAVRVLFYNLHVERWAFDVELLYVAERLRIAIREVQVEWHEVDGSKLTPIAASLQMARDLVLIRLKHMLGIWAIRRDVEQL